MESKDDYPGKQWQPIFDYMVDTFDLSLTLKEMEELIKGVSIAIGHTALQSKCVRYERALKKISHTSIVVGQPGSTWCDTDLDSVAVAAGYNQALDNIIPIANEALAGGGEKEAENEV
jgi:hypothetical protein